MTSKTPTPQRSPGNTLVRHIKDGFKSLFFKSSRTPTPQHDAVTPPTPQYDVTTPPTPQHDVTTPPTPQHDVVTPPTPQQSPGNTLSQYIKDGIKGGTVEGGVVHLDTEQIPDNLTEQTAYRNAQDVKFIGGLSAASSPSVVNEYNKLQAGIEAKKLEYEFKLKEQQLQFEQEMRRAELAQQQPAEQEVKKPAEQTVRSKR